MATIMVIGIADARVTVARVTRSVPNAGVDYAPSCSKMAVAPQMIAMNDVPTPFAVVPHTIHRS